VTPTTKPIWQRIPLPKTVAARRRLFTAAVLAVAAFSGYLTTCIVYPRSIFGRDHAVVRVIGMPITEAEQRLSGLGFKVAIEGDQPDPDVPAGAVLWQDPPPDVIVPQGTTVTLTRSSGPAQVSIPDLTDFELEAALKILLASGLKLGDVDSVPNNADPGVVLGTRPGPGAPQVPGSSVDLIVSLGPSTIAVPNVVGLRLDEALQRLQDAGLRVGRVDRATGRRGPPGTVLEQRPAATTRSARLGRVDLLVTEVN